MPLYEVKTKELVEMVVTYTVAADNEAVAIGVTKTGTVQPVSMTPAEERRQWDEIMDIKDISPLQVIEDGSQDLTFQAIPPGAWPQFDQRQAELMDWLDLDKKPGEDQIKRVMSIMVGDNTEPELQGTGRALLLSLLQKFGIRRVVYYYSGSGDEGGIDHIEEFAADNDASVSDFQSWMVAGHSLDDIMQEVTDHLLPWSWYDGDGASGTCTFSREQADDVLRIIIDHNEYYTDSTNSSWEVT